MSAQGGLAVRANGAAWRICDVRGQQPMACSTWLRQMVRASRDHGSPTCAYLLGNDPVHLGERALLAELVSIQARDQAIIDDVPPEKRRAMTLARLGRFVRYRARARPIVLIFEDLHWVDPTTASWLRGITMMSENFRALTIATFRPDFAFEGSDLPNVTRLALARLSRRQAVRIVKQQPGANSLGEALADQIAARSDGIFLLAEELTRSIVEFESDVADVPVTLHASLVARLDRLGDILGSSPSAIYPHRFPTAPGICFFRPRRHSLAGMNAQSALPLSLAP